MRFITWPAPDVEPALRLALAADDLWYYTMRKPPKPAAALDDVLIKWLPSNGLAREIFP